MDVLVHIATAAARMVEIGSTRLSGIRGKKNDPTLDVGSGVLLSVFVGQHDRQHASDDGLSVCVLDIWLLIQVDLQLEPEGQPSRRTEYDLLECPFSPTHGSLEDSDGNPQGRVPST